GTMKVLNESISIAKSSDIGADNIIIDPAVGFFRAKGKNPFFTKMTDFPWYIRDIEVISNLKKLKIFSKPICICVSRKSFIGYIWSSTLSVQSSYWESGQATGSLEGDVH